MKARICPVAFQKNMFSSPLSLSKLLISASFPAPIRPCVERYVPGLALAHVTYANAGALGDMK